MNHYYLVAGLPWLVLGEPPDITGEDFEARCGDLMPPADADEAVRLFRGDAAGCRSAFARDWLNADARLRNHAAVVRAARLKIDAGPYLREDAGWDGWIVKAVEDAFALAGVLDRELALDRVRWGVAEDLARPSPFGLPAVLAYAVKLRLAHRWAALAGAYGEDRLGRALGAIAEAAAP